MNPDVFKSKQTKEVIKYARDKYGNELEFLWPKFSNNAILRNKTNRKWYAAFLVIPRSKLGLESDEEVEILDLRFSKHEALDFVANNANFYPGYHMNKNNWFTIILDNSVPSEQIFDLLDFSYEISLKG